MTNMLNKRIGRKRREAIYKQIAEQLFNDAFLDNDPIWQRAIEIGRKKHIPITEAMKLAEQEFNTK